VVSLQLVHLMMAGSWAETCSVQIRGRTNDLKCESSKLHRDGEKNESADLEYNDFT
jgi:hypothetical protein